MSLKTGRWKLGRVRCAYCGVELASTRDHPIPVNLYPLEERTKVQMLKVPSCQGCNGTKSQFDNFLRDYLTIDLDSSQHDLAQQLQVTKTVVAAASNQVRLLDSFYDGRTVPAFTRDGAFDGLAYEIPIDPEPVRNAVEWVVRGLHWAVFDETIQPADVRVSFVDRYKRQDAIVRMAVLGWSGHYTQGEPFTGAWIMGGAGKVYWALVFFDSVLFLATTQRRAIWAGSDQ